MKIQWSIPGTKSPYKCSLLEIITQKSSSTLSEVIISYHFIPDEVAQQIVTAILNDGEQTRAVEHANLFNDLRKISPADIHWHARMLSIFPKLLSNHNPIGKLFALFAPKITWEHYAKKIFPYWSTSSFIDYYSGLTHKVQTYYMTIMAANNS